VERRSGRGAAVGDIDNDGSLEIVINNMNDTPSLLKNLGDKANWLLLKLVGTKSNRSGIGARVTVTAGSQRQISEVHSGGSYLSQDDLRLHFGLGSAQKADRVDVRWPSGREESFIKVSGNQIAVLVEGKGADLKPRP
jgi:hypothetical protein